MVRAMLLQRNESKSPMPVSVEPAIGALTPRISAFENISVESPAGSDSLAIQGFENQVESEDGRGQEKYQQQTSEGFGVKVQLSGRKDVDEEDDCHYPVHQVL